MSVLSNFALQWTGRDKVASLWPMCPASERER